MVMSMLIVSPSVAWGRLRGLRRRRPGARSDQLARRSLHDLVDPPGHGAVRFLHFGDLREHGALPRRPVLVRALFGLQLFCALPHRGPLLGREPLVGLLRAHRSLPCGFFLVRSLEEVYPRLRARTSPFLIGLVTR